MLVKNDPVLVDELEGIKKQLKHWLENIQLRSYGVGSTEQLEEIKNYYKDAKDRIKKVIELLEKIIELRIGELPDNLEKRHRLGKIAKKNSIIDFDTLVNRCKEEDLEGLGYLIGELRSKNVYYVCFCEYRNRTVGAESILELGFTNTQLMFLYRLSKKIEFPLPIDKERAKEVPVPAVVDKMIRMERDYDE